MNSFNFTGNVGNVKPMAFTPNNDAVLGFTMAFKFGFGKNENTTWINCSLFGKRAESVSPYVLKGSLLGVSGELNNRKWVDKDGAEKYSLECRVNDITLLGKKEGTATMQSQENKANDNYDDEIVF